MKNPDLRVDGITDDQNLEQKTDDIIQASYQAVQEAIEYKLELKMEHPAPSAVYISKEDVGITLHHGDGPVDFHLAGKLVNKQEFIENTPESLRKKLNKAIEVYSRIDDAQNELVSQRVIEARYA